MHIPILMVLTYIACCVRVGTAPWRYFQLNARYFSNEPGIFSKMRLDQLVPEAWHLPQNIDHESMVPASFPVFLKPEWGQNAHGIHRVETLDELIALRGQLRKQPRRYLVQEAAPEAREFEIFLIESCRPGRDILTVTEAVNTTERHPINSKFNRNTLYRDVTDWFTPADQRRLIGYIRRIGRFGISRLSVRADSTTNLLAGRFHVIELNLFIPMPINLLDPDMSTLARLRFIGRAMMSLAWATRALVPMSSPQPIFTRMMLYGRRHERDRSPAPGSLQRLARGRSSLS